MLKYLISLTLITVLTPAQASDTADQSWLRAQVMVPGSTSIVTVRDIPQNKKFPTVIYLHGCTGIVDWHDHEWARALQQRGYLVIMLDSMAREDRRPNCDPVNRRGGLFPQVHEFRQQEINWALDRILTEPWANTEQIYLIGHSEGGTAAAVSTRREFRARVILAWTCTFNREPAADGLRSPHSQPVLAVAADRDEWRVGRPTYGRCADRAEGRPVTQIDLRGSEHATTKYPGTVDRVLDWLNQHR